MSFRARTGHQEAVSRRLALLSAEVAANRPDPEAGEPDPPPPPPPPAAPPPAPTLPAPGRHSARDGRAPGVGWRGRLALGPGQLVVVAVLVAVGLAVTAWWVVRSEPRAVQAPAPLSTSGEVAPLTGASPAAGTPTGSASAGNQAGASATTTAATVTVDVTGEVRRPGIAVLDSGARVVDAVEAAGGARRDADLSTVNLARLLVDGEQIVVGATGSGPGAAPTGAPAAPGAPGAVLVNLNTASTAELEALPEVGPVTAQAIVSWRDQHGGFTAIEELLEVDGIGDATLAQISPHVTV